MSFLVSCVILILGITWTIQAQRPMLPEDKHAKYLIRFRALECKSTDNSTASFTFCNIKAYSRTFVALSFGIQTFRNFTNIFVRLVVYFRYGIIYREVIDTKLIHWCPLMDGIGSNPFFTVLMDVIKKSIPNLFHKCPYGGVMEFKNITIDNEIAKKISIFPEGQYKYNVTIGDKPDRIVLILVTFVETRSPVKSSFG